MKDGSTAEDGGVYTLKVAATDSARAPRSTARP